jgi:hypothetical protein
VLEISVYDPTDPMAKMFFNILATFAEFKSDLIRMRTNECVAIARSKGTLRGKHPKLSENNNLSSGECMQPACILFLIWLRSFLSRGQQSIER